MNSDNGAFSGPTNTTESNAPVTLTSPPQTAAVLSTSPIDTTTPADTIKPPIISVSAPDGSEELRVTSLLGAAHTGKEHHPLRFSASNHCFIDLDSRF